MSETTRDIMEFTQGDKTIRLVFLYGIQNRILKTTKGDVEGLLTDFEKQEEIINIMSKEYDSKGKETGVLLFDPEGLTSENAGKIIDFVSENICDFLLRRAESLKEITQRAQTLNKTMVSSVSTDGQQTLV